MTQPFEGQKLIVMNGTRELLHKNRMNDVDHWSLKILAT
jgi:hypothetical protein